MIGETVGWLSGERPGSDLRCGALLRRVRGQSRIRAGHPGRGIGQTAAARWCCATPTGVACPGEIAQAVAHVRSHFGFPAGFTVGEPGAGDPFILGIHAHDDSGCGVANTLEAVRAGAMHVQGTVNGYGERCGNANLISILANLQLKMGFGRARTREPGPALGDQPCRVGTGQHEPGSPPALCGQQCLCPQGGHPRQRGGQDGRLLPACGPRKVVGNSTRVLISELSGKDNIAVQAPAVRAGQPGADRGTGGTGADQGTGRIWDLPSRRPKPASN